MSMVSPCPWCGSRDVDWTVGAFSRVGRMYCVECEAQGPSFTTPDRADKAKTDQAALESWNSRP